MEPTSLIYLPDGTVLDPVAVAAIHPEEVAAASFHYRLLGDPVPRIAWAETPEHAVELRAYMVACKELSTPARVVQFLDEDVLRSMLVNPDGTLTSSGRYAPPEAFPKPEPSADHDEVTRPAVFSAREAIAETDLPADMSSADAIRELWARLTRLSNSRFETVAKKIAEVGGIELRARALGLWIGPGVPEGKEVLGVGTTTDFAVCVRDRAGRESFGFRESLNSDEASAWLDRHDPEAQTLDDARERSAPRGVDGGGEVPQDHEPDHHR